MKIVMRRLADNIIATVKEVDNEEYYCLSEILEQLGLKAKCFNEDEKKPITISGKIVWGFRSDSLNFLETIFIDKESVLALIKTQTRKKSVNLKAIDFGF